MGTPPCHFERQCIFDGHEIKKISALRIYIYSNTRLSDDRVCGKKREKMSAKTVRSNSENAWVLRDLRMAVDKYIDVI